MRAIMKKLILFTFILMVIGFMLLDTSDTNQKIVTTEIPIKTSKDEVIKKETTPVKTQIKTVKSSNKLNDEIESLLKKAEKLLEKSKWEEALNIYNLIIKKTVKTNDPQLLEHFVSACMTQGYIYQVYMNDNDGKDMAIEAYTKIINRFEKSDNIEFIQYYIDAKLQLAYLLPNDEKLEIYNELVSRFEKNVDNGIQKKIESLLISKSFQLMGQNDEEAMQTLDKVIEKYKDRDGTTELPENIQFSILNNIELALITNNESDNYVELAKNLMSNSPDTKPLLSMLEILKNSQELNQDEALAQWKEEFKDYRFEDWSFQEVERWAYRIEDKETKDRVTKYINAFVEQKYNIPDKNSNTVVYENNSDATETYNNTYNAQAEVYTEQGDEAYTSNEEEITQEEVDVEDIYNNDTNIEDENISTDEELYPDPYENSEPINYEPDPYAQEIYDATGEYPDPYE